ncbi:alpha/beta hydrolase [Lactobacillus sp. PV034]|uniref:alpha/beta hydrolase n=1 Tax=Lactobacillus sp. PV034 TaxID=2594495 RepID=UPI00223EE312|nr:alpha/beta hydrolase [Lactobacillus sp. PV034]QNQ81051.1 alpha/beta hydrolase [Lactobacillus sp. PV034]
MFFRQKKYAEEAEKNRKTNPNEAKPNVVFLTIIGLLGTFTPTRWLLRLHPRKIHDTSITEPLTSSIKQTPIIYMHGFRGGDYTTQLMVQETTKLKPNHAYLKVKVDLFNNFEISGTWTNDSHPIVQLVFKQNIVGVYAISYMQRLALAFLKKKYHFDHYDAIAHSLGAPSLVKTEMRVHKHKRYPHLDKFVSIAGPFDGVMYLGDIPNINHLTPNGRPLFMTWSYAGMLLQRKRFDPQIKVLNIYGNVLDETNSDKFISVTSAKSIRYILAPVVSFFEEIEMRGEMAEHSNMHDNTLVIKIINKFLGLIPENK